MTTMTTLIQLWVFVAIALAHLTREDAKVLKARHGFATMLMSQIVGCLLWPVFLLVVMFVMLLAVTPAGKEAVMRLMDAIDSELKAEDRKWREF